MPLSRQNATPLVSICYALLVFAGLLWAVVGTGLITGSHLGPHASGMLERDATVMSIPLAGQLPWFGLMLGLAVYAIWQCTPTARHTELHGRLRPWVLILVMLNALWLQLLQRDRIGYSLFCAAVMLAVLLVIVVMIEKTVLRNNMDRWITRASFGLFTGWLLVLVLAESVAFIALNDVDPHTLVFKGTAAFALLVLSLIICVATFKHAMGIYINAGALWVVLWITLDRFGWQLTSPMFAVVSAVAALILALCLISALRTRLPRVLKCKGQEQQNEA